MLSSLLGPQVRRWSLQLGKRLTRWGITPNALTVGGLLFNVLVAWVLAGGNFRLGGVLTLLAGVFDMLDGAVARAGNKVSTFGGFLDSTLDRYSEAVLFLGLLLYFLSDDNALAVTLVYVAIVGSIMTSYTRARSEAAGLRNETGVFQRTERVVLLGALLVLDRPLWALWILAIGANLTAAHRIYAVYRATAT